MLFEMLGRHAATSPDRLAIVCGDERITYRELDERTASLAMALRDRGLGKGSLVAVHPRRTAGAVIALLAAMRAGAAYTVVENDGNHSENLARLAAIGADAVIADDLMPPTIQESAGDVGARLEEVGADDTAYVLFTSGSSGRPKGVVVTHANIAHYVRGLLDRLAVTEPLSCAHVSSLAADLGNTSLFLGLWTSGTVHLVDDATRRDPSALLAYLHSADVELLKITPSHWSAVLRCVRSGSSRPRLRYLVLGGEVLTRGTARETLAAGLADVLVNHYGPTEATVGVCAHVLHDLGGLDGDPAESVPIGTPLGQTRLLVRTDDGDYRTTGTGELYVGGPQVARGYFGAPEDTQAAFVTDVDGASRFYRTGDVVRIDRNDLVVFLGRQDRQVKIDGYRVELDHVEAAARRVAGIRDAAAVVLDTADGDTLVAAVTVDSVSARSRDLVARLRATVPPYLIPTRLEVVAELPRTPNGKVNHAAVARLIRRAPGGGDHLARDEIDDIDGIRALWAKCLGHDDFTEHDDFFRIGGSSLDAIRLIAELQARGYGLTAREFQAEPTVAALSARMRHGPRRTPPGRDIAPDAVHRSFSPAQRDFFAADMPQPDHWNQAVAMASTVNVDVGLLASAAAEVAAAHPLLRTSYLRAEDGMWTARTLSPPEAVFSHSTEDDPHRDALRRHVLNHARRLHGLIDLARGDVFRVHLVSARHHDDQIILVAHHLGIDALSWRIVIDDLVRGYGLLARGDHLGRSSESTGFWDWVAHVERNTLSSAEEIPYWRAVLPGLRDLSTPRSEAGDKEGDAHTVWLAFSPEETRLVLDRVPERLGVDAHVALLGVFADALLRHDGADRTVVEVESHGRSTPNEDVDVSRVVGWFTSTFPIEVARGATAADTVAHVGAVLATVPRLGAAYGWHAADLGPLPSARLTYNYLGRFDFGPAEDLDLKPSLFPIGPARGPANDRGTPLKLTARIVGDQLVVDLSCDGVNENPEAFAAVLREAYRSLLRLVGGTGTATNWLIEPWSSAGLLAYVPESLKRKPGPPQARVYDRVLLTGATGYLGVYLLRALLTRTGTRVSCLVRDRGEQRAAERLRAAYRWHFPDEDLDAYANRYTVLAGDVGERDLGLPVETFDALSRNTAAIYHVAGDTRLFGSGGEISRCNVASVRTVIRLADSGRTKDLHYVSSLAACGVNTAAAPVTFAEHDLDVGQQFQNDYESSKFVAERLIRAFTARGGSGFVYRVGNVTGSSVTGRFQRNGTDNRLVQLLRAAVKIGRLPRDIGADVVLSPVDTVIDGILALSLDPTAGGQTFHVEGEHAISYREIFDTLGEIGFQFERDSARDFAELFEKYADGGDRDILLGLFWARRTERNVQFDHSRSRRRLGRLGVTFNRLDGEWLRRYLTHLVAHGSLHPSAREVRPEATATWQSID